MREILLRVKRPAEEPTSEYALFGPSQRTKTMKRVEGVCLSSGAMAFKKFETVSLDWSLPDNLKKTKYSEIIPPADPFVKATARVNWETYTQNNKIHPRRQQKRSALLMGIDQEFTLVDIDYTGVGNDRKRALTEDDRTGVYDLYKYDPDITNKLIQVEVKPSDLANLLNETKPLFIEADPKDEELFNAEISGSDTDECDESLQTLSDYPDEPLQDYHDDYSSEIEAQIDVYEQQDHPSYPYIPKSKPTTTRTLRKEILKEQLISEARKKFDQPIKNLEFSESPSSSIEEQFIDIGIQEETKRLTEMNGPSYQLKGQERMAALETLEKRWEVATSRTKKKMKDMHVIGDSDIIDDDVMGDNVRHRYFG